MNTFQRSSFFRLPSEAQLEIAKCLGHSEGVSRVYRFLSPELYNFRLVCKSFAVLGAKVLAWHTEVEPHSAYKSILFDFTDRSLKLTSAIAKNKELSSAIKSLYLILWRFKSEPFNQTALAEGNQVHTELATRWQQRQDFFRGDGIQRLATLLQEKFKIKNIKWIENDLDVRFLGRRPHRYLTTGCQIQCPSLGDSFSDMLSSFTRLQQQVQALTFLFENLTHLHLLSTAGEVPWQGSVKVGEDMMLTAKNLSCIRVEGEKNSDLLTAILMRGRYPRLKKLVLCDITCRGLTKFVERHSKTLQNQRIDDTVHEELNSDGSYYEELEELQGPRKPYYDDEEGLYRCSFCRWELVPPGDEFEPTCWHCERAFIVPAGFNVTNHEDSEEEKENKLEDEEYEQFIDDDGDEIDGSLVDFVDDGDDSDDGVPENIEAFAEAEEADHSSDSDGQSTVLTILEDNELAALAGEFREVDGSAEVDEFEEKLASDDMAIKNEEDDAKSDGDDHDGDSVASRGESSDSVTLSERMHDFDNTDDEDGPLGIDVNDDYVGGVEHVEHAAGLKGGFGQKRALSGKGSTLVASQGSNRFSRDISQEL